MKIPVLIEPISSGGIRVRSGEPLSLTAEGATREDALRNLRLMIEERLTTGTEVTQLDMPPYEHPFANYAGTWSPNDPVIQQWKQAVEDYRRQCEEDPDY